jgi:transcriptional regulator with XRE-family HTH domain
MSFGSNVRLYRIQRGLTLQELSKQLNVSVNYLSNLEQNKAKIKPDFLPKLCSALKIKLPDLYQENENNIF